MSESRPTETDGIARALGRIPSGLFIVTVRHDDKATGLLASWVQQVGFQPPQVTVAVRQDRFQGDWIRASGRFTLNQIAAGDKTLLRHFGKGFAPEEEAFQGLGLHELPDRSTDLAPILSDAIAFLDAEVAGEFECGDHRLILGNIVRGALVRDGLEPYVHVRQNGLKY